ncbi:hypothetical protein [Streptomyces halobius]|uniref:Uncharacterized protein n=1 Tax=Streptomyces halobius TaxID=2879846 RepID=A0ABY4MDZ7_9ACTN|nr:hypothetical protein [Streptomyces halobius]UQA95688.1 hypothetical protein K9S39_30910 [Streptomyces halobius]
MKRHVPTRATVVRAGRSTTLVSLESWFGGQILAQARTAAIVDAVGIPRDLLPDTHLWVMARLDAQAAEELHLRGWEPYDHRVPSARAA